MIDSTAAGERRSIIGLGLGRALLAPASDAERRRGSLAAQILSVSLAFRWRSCLTTRRGPRL